MKRRRANGGALPSLLALACLLPACARCHPVERAPGRVVALETELKGLSGLTRDAEGGLWAVAERGEAIARIDPATFAVTAYPLDGVPAGADLEAVTRLPDGRFVLGTERQTPERRSDPVLFATLRGDRASVTASRTCDYGRWQLEASDNHGLEGLCDAGGRLLVVTELVVERDGARWAPIGLYDESADRWTPFSLRLTSETGKLSAVDCREADGAIEALAVERHFGVARLLRFRVPLAGEGGAIEPTVALDLAAEVEPLPNFEGLVWERDGAALLLTDNQYRMDTGEPTRLYHVPAALLR